jgi:hypothetical protein
MRLPVPYQHIIACFTSLLYYPQEGFAALWTGIGPNVARNAIINAAELASYDQVKQVPSLFLAVTVPSISQFARVTGKMTLLSSPCRLF